MPSQKKDVYVIVKTCEYFCTIQFWFSESHGALKNIWNLKYENNSLRDILFKTLKQYSGSCLKLHKSLCKDFLWKYIENESYHPYIG